MNKIYYRINFLRSDSDGDMSTAGYFIENQGSIGIEDGALVVSHDPKMKYLTIVPLSNLHSFFSSEEPV